MPVSGIIGIPASLRSDFIHIAGMPHSHPAGIDHSHHRNRHLSWWGVKLTPFRRLMLVGFVFAQTKHLSNSSVPPKLNQTTINIGMDLQLGMSRDVVITQIGANYKVVKIQVVTIGLLKIRKLRRI